MSLENLIRNYAPGGVGRIRMGVVASLIMAGKLPENSMSPITFADVAAELIHENFALASDQNLAEKIGQQARDFLVATSLVPSPALDSTALALGRVCSTVIRAMTQAPPQSEQDDCCGEKANDGSGRTADPSCTSPGSCACAGESVPAAAAEASQ